MLFQTIWPKVYVNEAVLSQYIREIRKALRDKPKKPQFIETMHRRGYRFIASVTNSPLPGSSQTSAGGEASIRPMIREAATIIGSQPLVGRARELSFLQERLEATLQGDGSLTFISGPAGIGKTRLARELRDCGHQMGCQWLEGKYDKAGSYPYQPWVEMVRGYLDRGDATSLQELAGPYAGRLVKLVARAAGEVEGVPDSPRIDPQVERMQLFEALTHFFVKISHVAPLVLFLDDLQWAPSIELMNHLAQKVRSQRIQVLGAYREDELKEKSNLWYTVLNMNRERLFHTLPLEPLGEREVGQLMAAMFNESIAPELVELVYHKTEGIPFFVEEVLRLLQQRKAIVQTVRGWEMREGAPFETPDSVKAVINERLERLGKKARDLLRMVSVIGREFSYRLLRELVDQEERVLIEVIDRCEEAGLVLSRRVPGEVVYVFTHDLMQEALYESIGPARRRRYHLQIGQVMEKLYAFCLDEHYEALAHHFLEGDDLEKAVAYSREAGAKAVARSAFGQAVAYFEQALNVLGHLPESRETLEQAIAIRIDLGPVLMATKGFGAPEVESSYNSARELCERFGETPQLFPVLWGLWLMKNFRGEQQTARELGERLLAVADREQDTSQLLQAHHALWTTLFTTGELVGAIDHCRQGLAIYDPQQHRSHTFLYGGHDPGMCCHGHAARTLWMLGYPDQALKHAKEGIKLARELSHPFSIALALNYASEVHYQRGQWEDVAECAKPAAGLAADRGFPLVIAFSEALLGRLLIEQGRGKEGISQINRALAGVRDTGGYRMALLLSVFAGACCRLGQIEQGLQAAANALPMCEKYAYESEVRRLKGELILQSRVQNSESGVQKEAEECFCQALEVARSQSAKSLELRAAISLSRLWQRQDKQKDAQQLLAQIYNWFTEGLDTADLKEAKELLDGLS
jgi:predicted ATPase